MLKIRTCRACMSPATLLLKSYHEAISPVIFTDVQFYRERDRDSGTDPISVKIGKENFEARLNILAKRGIEFSEEAVERIRTEVEQYGEAKII